MLSDTQLISMVRERTSLKHLFTGRNRGRGGPGPAIAGLHRSEVREEVSCEVEVPWLVCRDCLDGEIGVQPLFGYPGGLKHVSKAHAEATEPNMWTKIDEFKRCMKCRD